jgi:hypothetical protein
VIEESFPFEEVLAHARQRRSSVKASAVHQGNDGKHSLPIFNFVADNGGVLITNHENGLLDPGISYSIA